MHPQFTTTSGFRIGTSRRNDAMRCYPGYDVWKNRNTSMIAGEDDAEKPL